jgi:hypothetical protein
LKSTITSTRIVFWQRKNGLSEPFASFKYQQVPSNTIKLWPIALEIEERMHQSKQYEKKPSMQSATTKKLLCNSINHNK